MRAFLASGTCLSFLPFPEMMSHCVSFSISPICDFRHSLTLNPHEYMMSINALSLSGYCPFVGVFNSKVHSSFVKDLGSFKLDLGMCISVSGCFVSGFSL